jgi:hypothetical protein
MVNNLLNVQQNSLDGALVYQMVSIYTGQHTDIQHIHAPQIQTCGQNVQTAHGPFNHLICALKKEWVHNFSNKNYVKVTSDFIPSD